MKRVGIYRGWPTEKSILAWIEKSLQECELRWHRQRAELIDYARGANPYLDALDQSRSAAPPYSYDVKQSLSNSWAHALLMISLFDRQPQESWIPHALEYYGYEYWRTRLEHRARSRTAQFSFNAAVEALAGGIVLGWHKHAQDLAAEILAIYGARRFYDISGVYAQPLYHWLVRIVFDHHGWSFDGWGRGLHGQDLECLSEPVLNELFAHWRDRDLSPFKEQLIWLCNYYTHRTRNADGLEFGNDLLQARFPATILAWFRLRDELQLPIPEIDHPLMQPGYAKLIPSQAFYSDELLDAVLARLRREEIPDLGEVSVFDNPSSSAKSNLLSRLLRRR